MLRKMILEDCQNNRGLAQELAKIAGYSSGSALLKMLRKDINSDCEKLDGLLKIAKYLYPEKFDDIILEFAKNLNPNRITARLLLEYVTLYRMTEVAEYLINALKNSESAEVKNGHLYMSQIPKDLRVK